MKAIDLIRNFMLDFYSTEKEQIQFYQDYWVPLEKVQTDQDILEQKFR